MCVRVCVCCCLYIFVSDTTMITVHPLVMDLWHHYLESMFVLYHQLSNACDVRRTFGGRSLWESKDDRRWGHDKFEEVTMRARNYDEVS